MTQPIIVIGAGIVGVSTAIWLARAGRKVTLVDRGAPGMGTSYGNGGVLAACGNVPVTGPGLIHKGPGYLLNREFPLFLRWSYLPKLVPWLIRYLSHANDADTRRIAAGLAPIVGDSVDQHKALTQGTDAAAWLADSPYSFAFRDRAAFEADAYSFALRREHGFAPDIIEGPAVQEFEPALGPSITCLAVMRDHGFIRDPAAYVAALADELQKLGGIWHQSEVRDFTLTDGRVSAVVTDRETLPCSDVVLATGVWSKPLMAKLGLKVPLESERGYHIVFEGPENGPSTPLMVAAGKFVATPMQGGLRCAGVVEFGGLEAGPSRAPFALLRRQVAQAFPNLTTTHEEEWQGHRPAPADSLPLIGPVGVTGVYAGFGHHHIGLTGGPKTGRLIAQMITGAAPNMDMRPYDPQRFAS
jgi:glycine/D-amino acid oxidase-like deaminating enzyme